MSWELQGWLMLSLVSLAKKKKKTLPNSGSKITSTMLLSHFENCLNSIHLSTFNVLSISESISRGNKIPWRSVPRGSGLSWIPPTSVIQKLEN